MYLHLKELQTSSKFGKVLPVDFDYIDNQIPYYPTEEIFSELKDYLLTKESPDYIWLKGINDINLLFGFNRLLKKIKENFPNQKMGVYINCSLFNYERVRKALLICDLIVINLNSVTPSNFHKSCICFDFFNVQEILNGIRIFRKEFKGYFRIYTMFFKGVNDNLDTVRDLKKFLLEINPDHFSVNVFTGKDLESVSNEFKTNLKEIFHDLPFKVSFRF